MSARSCGCLQSGERRCAAKDADDIVTNMNSAKMLWPTYGKTDQLMGSVTLKTREEKAPLGMPSAG